MESDSSAFGEDTADSMLAALRSHPEWTVRERDFHLGRIVERFPTDVLMDAVVRRLADLRGADAESLLRLIEGNLSLARLKALAEALERQVDLPSDRAWDALSLLDENNMLDDYPSLLERWDDLNETLDDGGSIDDLIEQIEGDPDGLWMALQGLNAVEAEIRPTIIDSLAEHPLGPGLAEFLRLLIYSNDLPTRNAALRALNVASTDTPAVRNAWLDLSRHHDDADVVSTASRQLQLATTPGSGATSLASFGSPRIIGSSITSIDQDGRAVIVLQSIVGSRSAVAMFLCQIERGVIDVDGKLFDGETPPEGAVEGLSFENGREAITDIHPLAISLLAGTLLLNGDETPPSLRFWIETTLGRDFRPHPFRASFPDWDPSLANFDDMPERVEAILEACPDWIDRSPLTSEIAEEILLRERDPRPHSKRDAGAIRYLFEHRLKNDLESYRRRLLWMAWFWRESGREDLGRSALGLAWQLSDPQHIVPGHPFPTAIAIRSLEAAQRNLRGGSDPRAASESER